MTNQIKCPKCGELFEPGDAYKHELEETIRRESQAQHQQDLEEAKKEVAEATKAEVEKKAKEELEVTVEAVRKEADSNARRNRQLKEELEDNQKLLSELKEDKAKTRRQHEQELDEVRKKSSEEARKEAEEKVRKELETQLAASKEEAEARDKQNKELRDQLQDLLKQMRELKDEKDKLSVEYEKKLLEGQDKIKDDAKKEAREELDLKIAEKDKKLQDAEKQILELQRKIQQGSQQLQGEVQELELEQILKAEFPFDEIKEVPKGVNGADVLQVVRTQVGKPCGVVIWESKRTKNWTFSWIPKLKEDQRAVKADLAVLVSNILPNQIVGFGAVDGVLVSDMKAVLGVAYLLRQQLIKVQSAQLANEGKATKAEVVYNYLISNEFKQRIEVWVEYFRERQEKINKERVYFNKKWQEEEKSIQKVMANTSGIYGDLQGLIGNALPKVSYLELPDVAEPSNEDDGLPKR